MGKLIGKLKDSNKNTIITIAMFTSFAVGIIILVIGMTIYKYRIAKLGFADFSIIKNISTIMWSFRSS